MKRLIVVLCFMVMTSGCLGVKVDRQILKDTLILSTSEVIVRDLARHVKKNHQEDVQRYIKYCDAVLLLEDSGEVENYINIGIDALADKYSDDLGTALLIASIKGSFTIDADTGDIDFDKGSRRIALNLISAFRNALEE